MLDFATATDNGNSSSYSQTGLSCNSINTLYVWSYNVNGNSTPLKLSVNTDACPSDCGGSTQFTDSRDGNVYNIVAIDNQCWMLENLKYLPSVVGPQTSSFTVPYYYVYGYDGTDVNAAKASSNYDTYGVLYNGLAATGGSNSNNIPSGVTGVCPSGWHLPSDAEFIQMEMYLGMTAAQSTQGTTNGWRGSNQGSKMAGNSALWGSGVLKINPEFDMSGFSAIPGGTLSGDQFWSLGTSGSWWTSRNGTYNPTCTYIHSLSFDRQEVKSTFSNANTAVSVRCLKD